jgi:hypothetical protein
LLLKSWIWQESENRKNSGRAQVFFNRLLHLATEQIGLSWSPRRKRGPFGFFVHAWEKVGRIVRSSSGGVLELEDSDDDSTNGEGHAQGPEHEAIHPAL